MPRPDYEPLRGRYLLHRLADWSPRPGAFRACGPVLLWAITGFWAWIWYGHLWLHDTGVGHDRDHVAVMPIMACLVFAAAAIITTLVSLWRWEEERITEPERRRERIARMEREAGLSDA